MYLILNHVIPATFDNFRLWIRRYKLCSHTQLTGIGQNVRTVPRVKYCLSLAESKNYP